MPNKPHTDRLPPAWRQSGSQALPSVPVPDRLGWLRGVLLLVWALASFGLMYFARDLSWQMGAWPLNFWLAAQGLVLLFVLIVVIYAYVVNRAEAAQLASTPIRDARD